MSLLSNTLHLKVGDARLETGLLPDCGMLLLLFNQRGESWTINIHHPSHDNLIHAIFKRQSDNP